MAIETGQGTGRTKSEASRGSDIGGGSGDRGNERRDEPAFSLPDIPSRSGSAESEGGSGAITGTQRSDTGRVNDLFDPGVNQRDGSVDDRGGTVRQRQLFEYFGGDSSQFPETETNILQDILGISERLEVDPFEGNFREVYDIGISPLSVLAGVLLGPVGTAGTVIARLAGLKDPLGFDVTIDPADVGRNVAERAITGRIAGEQEEQKEDDEPVTTAAARRIQEEESEEGAEAPGIADRVAEIIEQTGMTGFPMPEFQLLDSDFGQNLFALRAAVEEMLNERTQQSDTQQT